MKTLKILALAIMFASLTTTTTQAQYLDIGVLAGGVTYQKFVPDARVESVLYFWGTYFTTTTISDLLKRWDAPRSIQILAPVLFSGAALYTIEALGKGQSFANIQAGMYGLGTAAIRISFKF